MVSLTKWLIYGLVGAFAVSALIDPARAQGTIGAFGGIGTALGNLGRGTQSLLSGVGTGASQLLNPLWTLRDLIYGPQAGVQTGTDVRQSSSTDNLSIQQTPYQQQSIELDPNAAFTPVTTGFGGTPAIGQDPYSQTAAEQGAAIAASNVINPTRGFSFQSLPQVDPNRPVSLTNLYDHSNVPLSQGAINWYQSKGILVSPSSNQTVAAENPSNATGASAASPNFQAGAAQAAGYSTGMPANPTPSFIRSQLRGHGGNSGGSVSASGYSAGARTAHRSTGGFGAAN